MRTQFKIDPSVCKSPLNLFGDYESSASTVITESRLCNSNESLGDPSVLPPPLLSVGEVPKSSPSPPEPNEDDEFLAPLTSTFIHDVEEPASVSPFCLVPFLKAE